MIDQYNDFLVTSSRVIDTEPYQDSNGDWVFPGDNPIITTKQQCRAEVNSSSSMVPGKDGIKVEYSFLIYMPVDAVEIPLNTDLIIQNRKGEEIGKGTVKRFYRNTMNARLWV